MNQIHIMDAVRHLGDVVLHAGVADVIHGKMLLVPVKCLTLPVVAHVRIADYRRSIFGDMAEPVAEVTYD